MPGKKKNRNGNGQSKRSKKNKSQSRIHHQQQSVLHGGGKGKKKAKVSPPPPPLHLHKEKDASAVSRRNNQACKRFYRDSQSHRSAIFLFEYALEEGFIVLKQSRMDAIPETRLEVDIEVIRHNLAISALFTNKYPMAAFRLLDHCVSRYPLNPRLLLRFAEACVQVNVKIKNSEMCIQPENYDIVTDLSRSSSEEYKYEQSNETYMIKTFAIKPSPDGNGYPSPNIKYALSCLKQAIRDITKALKDGSPLSVLPSLKIVNPHQIFCLYTSTVLLTAYVALKCGEFATAIEKSREILELRKIPPVYKYCAKIYYSMAFCRLDCQKGLSFISRKEKKFKPNFHFRVPREKKKDVKEGKRGKRPSNTLKLMDSNDWTPNTQSQADILKHYQQLIALIRAGRLNEAFTCLNTLFQNKMFNPPPAYVKLYLHLSYKYGCYEKVYSTCLRYSSLLQSDVAMKLSMRNITRHGFPLLVGM